MKELGQLEEQHEAFADRAIRIVAISDDDQSASEKTQSRFPHIEIVSDPDQNIARAVQVIHPGVKPGGGDTNAPTTFLVDEKGYVRWWFRPDRYITRLTAEELLAKVDETLK